MPPGPLIIIIALALGTVAYVARPLWRRDVRPGALAEGEGEPIDELLARRDVTYRALKEIEFDFQAGKLLEEDYQALLARYRAEAVAILQQLDEATAEMDAQIEREVAALRRSAALSCPACGRHYQEGG
jgi:hypothetical protein